MISANAMKSGPAPLQGVFASITSVIRFIFAAASVANAVERHRKPLDADLRIIGIAPEQFTVRL